MAMVGSVTDTQLHRYNFETLDLLRESLADWGDRFSCEGQPLTTHLIKGAEDRIDGPEERESEAFQELLAELQVR